MIVVHSRDQLIGWKAERARRAETALHRRASQRATRSASPMNVPPSCVWRNSRCIGSTVVSGSRANQSATAGCCSISRSPPIIDSPVQPRDGLGSQPLGDQRPERIQFSLMLDRSEQEGQRAWPGESLHAASSTSSNARRVSAAVESAAAQRTRSCGSRYGHDHLYSISKMASTSTTILFGNVGAPTALRRRCRFLHRTLRPSIR